MLRLTMTPLRRLVKTLCTVSTIGSGCYRRRHGYKEDQKIRVAVHKIAAVLKN